MWFLVLLWYVLVQRRRHAYESHTWLFMAHALAVVKPLLVAQRIHEDVTVEPKEHGYHVYTGEMPTEQIFFFFFYHKT